MRTHAAGGLLGSDHLGLESGGVLVDPLELGEVTVEDTDDLAELLLFVICVSNCTRPK